MDNEDVERTRYFNDGLKRIDIVLVIDDGLYEENVDKIKIDFLIYMIKIGLEVEVEPGRMKRHEGLLFVKIHAPDPIIKEYGTYYNIRKYFKGPHNEFINPGKNPLGMETESDLIKIVRRHYTGPLNYSNIERSSIVYHILLALPFGRNENFIGVQRLIERNIIVDMYALHDGPYFFLKDQKSSKINARQILFYNWVGKENMFKKQPLHLIREYFGEKVAFYFAFYEFFIIGLILASILGIFVGFDGFYDISFDGGIKEICSKVHVGNDSVTAICPLCRDFNKCPFRDLTDFCVKFVIIHFVENPMNLIYCLFLSLWAMMFVLLWRRRKNYISWIWEYDQTDTISAARSEYDAYPENLWTSKLTGIVTDADTIKNRTLQLLITLFTLLLWGFTFIQGLFVTVIVIYFLIYKYDLSAQFNRLSTTWSNYLAIITTTCINLLVMSILQKFTRSLAYQLTRFENHKTNNSFETSLIKKLYGFGFICNFFSMISYYFLNVLYTYPSDKSRWYLVGGIGMMNCGPESCLDELCVSIIATILIQEYIMKLPACFLKTKTDYTNGRHKFPCWEREFLLQPLTEYVLIEKFNNLVMIFTLLGLFGTAFPLTPLLLLISGIFKVRYEARLFLVGSRRPLLRQPSSQNVWYTIMFTIVYVIPCFNTMAMTWMTTTIQYPETQNLSNNILFSMGKFVTEDYYIVTGPGSPAEDLSKYKGVVPSQCLFPGLRFRSKKLDGQYFRTERFWRIRYDKHRLMLDVQHLSLFIMVILHYVIPAYPRDIKDTMEIERKILHRARVGKKNW